MFVTPLRMALSAAVAATAFGVGTAPANAVYACTPKAGTSTTYVYHCQDVVIVGGGIVTAAGDFYFCVLDSCNKVHLDRNGAGVNTSTRQVCYMVVGNGYYCI